MRDYKVQVNGRTYTVSVSQTGKRKFQVTIGGENFECHSFRSDTIVSWSIHKQEKTLHARARTLHLDKVDVWLAGTPFQASVHAATPGHSAISRIVGVGNLTGEIRATMPGRITSVLVTKDELVDEGTPLLILESMKMQNEIVSPTSGHVKAIHVKDGATVKKDAVLIEVG